MNRSASHAQLRSQPHWILMIAVLVSSSIAQIDWIIETPDGPRQFAYRSDRSLAVDAFGRPHMAYGEDGLYYACSDGASWHIEGVDSTPQVGAWAAIALDAFGRPHISYADSDRDVLRHAYRGPAGWSIETADTTNGVGRYTFLCIPLLNHHRRLSNSSAGHTPQGVAVHIIHQVGVSTLSSRNLPPHGALPFPRSSVDSPSYGEFSVP